MFRASFLLPSIKITSAFALSLLISSSQSDCSSDTGAIAAIADTTDTLGSCFTHHQNGYLPLPQSLEREQTLAVTGNKYHF